MPRARHRSRPSDAAGAGDGPPQEVLETLSCAVEVVALAVEAPEARERDAELLWGAYGALRWRWPVEQAMAAANAASLRRLERAATASAVETQREVAELDRLAASAGESERARGRLEALRARKQRALRGNAEPPRELEVPERTAEDPLEARRDARGEAVPLREFWRSGLAGERVALTSSAGRNVIGEPFAPRRAPLSYARGKTPAEIYARMKRAVKDDVVAREQRRIAALNARAAARKQELEALGYLSPEAALEARFDHLMH